MEAMKKLTVLLQESRAGGLDVVHSDALRIVQQQEDVGHGDALRIVQQEVVGHSDALRIVQQENVHGDALRIVQQEQEEVGSQALHLTPLLPQ